MIFYKKKRVINYSWFKDIFGKSYSIGLFLYLISSLAKLDDVFNLILYTILTISVLMSSEVNEDVPIPTKYKS